MRFPLRVQALVEVAGSLRRLGELMLHGEVLDRVLHREEAMDIGEVVIQNDLLQVLGGEEGIMGIRCGIRTRTGMGVYLLLDVTVVMIRHRIHHAEVEAEVDVTDVHDRARVHHRPRPEDAKFST
jgi:hypothetical protein